MSATTQDQILIEQRVANERPSLIPAYILRLFLGFLSAHRFYLGRTASAIFEIVQNCIVIGVIWLVVDLFLMPGMVRANQASVRDRLMRNLQTSRPASGAALSPPDHF
ncbi:TM2 domain-containing protein [Methylobacterium sp. J-026]|uniref:TM2 domain-containing protein n=1 Tax=Methylobacterium sp. J-026 TaxID=2836624 RepID=UPI001FBB605C|nr:TM2 domain-containing protein [Methylobacterium sp. J-026]MCJ2133680.1 TM2 domain-containing protein [Methylobacterium sp. J-026]